MLRRKEKSCTAGNRTWAIQPVTIPTELSQLVVLQELTKISDEPAVFIFRTEVPSKTLVTIYKTTWFNNPEDHNLNFHPCESLKSNMNKNFQLFV
jgi:hypothetical protein